MPRWWRTWWLGRRDRGTAAWKVGRRDGGVMRWSASLLRPRSGFPCRLSCWLADVLAGGLAGGLHHPRAAGGRPGHHHPHRRGLEHAPSGKCSRSRSRSRVWAMDRRHQGAGVVRTAPAASSADSCPRRRHPFNRVLWCHSHCCLSCYGKRQTRDGSDGELHSWLKEFWYNGRSNFFFCEGKG